MILNRNFTLYHIQILFITVLVLYKVRYATAFGVFVDVDYETPV